MPENHKNNINPDYAFFEETINGSELLFKHLWDISVDGMRLTDNMVI